MNWIDVLLLLIVILAMWSGWKTGFITGSVNLFVWVGSLIAGFLLYRYPGDLLARYFPSLGVWTFPLAFMLSIIAARIILSMVFNLFLKNTPGQVHHNEINHVLGLVPGFINGLIYATIIAALLLSVPLMSGLSATTRDSKLANKFADNVAWLNNKLSPIFSPAIQKSLTRFTVEPESNETVKLHFTVTNPKVRSDLESQMLGLVNEERTKRGLNPLKPDPELTLVARAHSRDMFSRGYFSHYTPEGKDPFVRMNDAGVKFLSAGENLALGQSLEICHQGLMNSPGHRANILNSSYGRIGIGILDGGIYGLMISQEFRN